MTYKEYLTSDDWKFLRNEIIRIQEGQCAHCGRDIKEVHHITYPQRWCEDSTDNLIGLCGSCHMEEHGINIPKSERIKQAIWDYVLVEVEWEGGHCEALDGEQCQFDPIKKCVSKHRKEKECENYAGKITLDECEYIICDNREVEDY